MAKSLLIIFIFFSFVNAEAQRKLISGPWAGNVELRTAMIWAEISPSAKKVTVIYAPHGENKWKMSESISVPQKEFSPIKISLTRLEMNTAYDYVLLIDGEKVKTDFSTTFKTKDLWQWRKPAPDFSFLAGSCAYFNEPEFDRPGKPYGGDSSIFKAMANTPAAFHVWMGDNWYTREVDYTSSWGMEYRASRDRAQPILQSLMAAMPQYAIWDDHDYGPDDEGKSFVLKDESREIFKKYSLNPSYGEDGKGIYTKISYSDVDLFLTDDRFFRSEDEMPDSINGKPSAEKTFFGARQMEWLKNSLRYSKATFKIIVVGSQVLNPLNTAESMRSYSYEFTELMNFLDETKIPGIIFFSGDRHHSEVIKINRVSNYALYDVTVSPYTSGVSIVKGAEIENPYRVKGTLVEAQNFGRITVSGAKGGRKLSVNFIDISGSVLGTWQVLEDDLISREYRK